MPFPVVETLGADRYRVYPQHFDAIVLTQSCDINETDDSAHVLMARMHWLRDALGDAPELLQKLEDIRKGYVPRFYLLPAVPDFGEDRLIDLAELRTIRVRELLAEVSNGLQRVSLTSPHLEHFSQAVARSFMRVGLPTDLPPCAWKEKPGFVQKVVSIERLEGSATTLTQAVDVAYSERWREGDDLPLVVAMVRQHNKKTLQGIGRSEKDALASLERVMEGARDSYRSGADPKCEWVSELFGGHQAVDGQDAAEHANSSPPEQPTDRISE